MQDIIAITNLCKTYRNNFTALRHVDLAVRQGEIFGLLGPNGAGKTTLINIVCGLVNPSAGTVSVAGYDIIKDFRHTRAMIGLVPQELATNFFETVWDEVQFSRGLFGLDPDPDYLARIIHMLGLWDKKDSRVQELSGGMKRRVLIAKALSHEPTVLFLDEPSAGVDVELRTELWKQIRILRDTGVTIILTTHYIEEAEQMADRIGMIKDGTMVLVEEKSALLQKCGKKRLTIELQEPMTIIPEALQFLNLTLHSNGRALVHSYDIDSNDHNLPRLLQALGQSNIGYRDIHTSQSSLEDIFVSVVGRS
jgi:ABC-2 type transport system ATP-binding protein